MTLNNSIRLIALAAIWGSSFIFMRVLAPVLGPFVTTDLRVLLAGIALTIYFFIIKYDAEWKIFEQDFRTRLTGLLNLQSQPYLTIAKFFCVKSKFVF